MWRQKCVKGEICFHSHFKKIKGCSCSERRKRKMWVRFQALASGASFVEGKEKAPTLPQSHEADATQTF